jgi:hypothetical protein
MTVFWDIYTNTYTYVYIINNMKGMNHFQINEMLIIMGYDSFLLREQTPELLYPCFQG